MKRKEIVEYVMHTPGNTNRAILEQMLEQIGENTVTVNPDGSGTIKVDLYNRVLSPSKGNVIVKVADEPFRTDPNVPIELTRIGKIQFSASPWLNFNDTDGSQAGEQQDFLNAFEACKTPWSVELGEGTYDDHSDDGFDTIYLVAPSLEQGDDYFIRVPESAPNFLGTDVTLLKGLYVCCNNVCYPSSFEIFPAAK